MKAIVINDLYYNQEQSIIPYCMRLCRDLGLETDVIDVMDPRIVHGRYSPYSDSQSLTVDVSSSDEIIKRAKHFAELNLDKFISKELPLLNYPLIVRYNVDTGDSEEIIVEKSKQDDVTIIMLNSRPVTHNGELYNDPDYLIRNSYSPLLLVPPGHHYQKPENVVYPGKFVEKDIDHIFNVVKNIKTLKSKLYLVNLNHKVKTELQADNKRIRGLLMEKADYFSFEISIAPQTDIEEVIEEFGKKTRIDLIIIPNDEQKIIDRLIKENFESNNSKIFEVPILVVNNIKSVTTGNLSEESKKADQT